METQSQSEERHGDQDRADHDVIGEAVRRDGRRRQRQRRALRVMPRLERRGAVNEADQNNKQQADEDISCSPHRRTFGKYAHCRDPSLWPNSLAVPTLLMLLLRLGVTAVEQRVVVVQVEMVRLQ